MEQRFEILDFGSKTLTHPCLRLEIERLIFCSSPGAEFERRRQKIDHSVESLAFQKPFDCSRASSLPMAFRRTRDYLHAL